MFIYLITNKINGKKYVGQTTRTVEERFRNHCNNKRHSIIALAIRKYGKDSFTIETLATASSREELNLLEKRYIEELNTLEPNGYNLKTGGSEQCDYSPMVKARMRKAKLGRKLPDETRKRMSESHQKNMKDPILRGKVVRNFGPEHKTPEYYASISKRMTEFWSDDENRKSASEKSKDFVTDEWKALIGERVKEAQQNMAPESKARLDAARERHQRPVIDNAGNVYPSVKAAAAAVGCHGSSIIKQIAGEYKTAGGRVFQYYRDAEKRPLLYLVCGVPGAGKSWVISQLNPSTHTYISYDKNRKKDHLRLLEDAGAVGKPVIYDPTFKVSTFIRRHGHLFDIRPIFILEDETTLRSRIAGRGGEWTDSLTKRIIQIGKRADKYGVFQGTSDEVLAFMLETLTGEDPVEV